MPHRTRILDLFSQVFELCREGDVLIWLSLRRDSPIPACHKPPIMVTALLLLKFHIHESVIGLNAGDAFILQVQVKDHT